MQGIGERLEEARKRKGISLREASEATKIRSDFLGSIEQSKFDFELPDIYKRGFLKNYARYLKLDHEKLLADYNAHQSSGTRFSKKGAAELFGEIKAPTKTSPPFPEEEVEQSYGRISARQSKHKDPQSSDAERAPHEDDKLFYIKIGLVFVGTLALVFVVFGLIRAILGSGSKEAAEASDLQEPSAITESANPSAGSVAGRDIITLTASGNVYVLVKQRNDNKELYRKTMSAGESVPLQKAGPVDILFTAGENLVIEHGGERLRPSTSGTAKITIP